VILLDTSVLSFAFRRVREGDKEHPAVSLVRRLVVEDAPLVVPGVVVQELLSGLASDQQFARLAKILDSFPTLLADRSDHVAAARIANTCRRAGVPTSTTDCLIAALTVTRGAALLTLDKDFERLTRYCGLRLLDPTSGRVR
jgi:predicted nucleic acid-binding protein